MRFIKLNIIVVFVFITSISCNKVHNPIMEKKFEIEKQLPAQNIVINEIIKLDNIYKSGDYAIIRDGSAEGEYFLYVYKLPEFEFLYAFARRGRGPGEFLMPTIIKNMPENQIAFRDHATDEVFIYKLNDRSADIILNFKISSKEDKFLWEINYIDESLFIAKRSDNKWVRRELWDLQNSNMISQISNTFNLEKKMGKRYYSDYDDFWIVSNGNKVAFGYFFIDVVEFGVVDGGRIELENAVGSSKLPDFYMFDEPDRKGVYEYNIDNNIVYYESLYGGDKYVYCLYADKPWGEVETSHSDIIEVFDWTGIPYSKLYLEHGLSNFIVDEKSNTIYGFNENSNDEYIYKYEM